MRAYPGDRNNIDTLFITISKFPRCVFLFGKATTVCYRRIPNKLYRCEIQSKGDDSPSKEKSGVRRFSSNSFTATEMEDLIKLLSSS